MFCLIWIVRCSSWFEIMGGAWKCSPMDSFKTGLSKCLMLNLAKWLAHPESISRAVERFIPPSLFVWAWTPGEWWWVVFTPRANFLSEPVTSTAQRSIWVPLFFIVHPYWFLKSQVMGIWWSKQKQRGQQPFWKGVFMQVCWMNMQVGNSTFDLEMSKLCFYLDLVPAECWTMCIFCTRQSAESASLQAHWQQFSVNEF